jgi:hypothetical protein
MHAFGWLVFVFPMQLKTLFVNKVSRRVECDAPGGCICVNKDLNREQGNASGLL